MHVRGMCALHPRPWTPVAGARRDRNHPERDKRAQASRFGRMELLRRGRRVLRTVSRDLEAEFRVRSLQTGSVVEIEGATTSEDSVNRLAKLARGEGKKTRRTASAKVAEGWLQR